MVYQELEELGLQTVAIDTHSFVSKTIEKKHVWLEFFCCNEKNYLQIMRANRADKNEVIRETLYEGKIDMSHIKQVLR